MPTAFQSRAREAFEEVKSAPDFTVKKHEIEGERERPLTEDDAKLIRRYLGPAAVDKGGGPSARRRTNPSVMAHPRPSPIRRVRPQAISEPAFPDHDYTSLRERLKDRL